MVEGRRFIGIEKDAAYLAIARKRIEWWARQPEGVDTAAALAHGRRERPGQQGLFA